MNAFRLTGLANGKIGVHGRVSMKDIKHDALRACKDVLRRLREGEQAVAFPTVEVCMFEVRLGLPAWIETYIPIHKCAFAEYDRHCFHLTINGGQMYEVCLVLGDEDADDYAADMVVPLFLASIPGHVPGPKHTYRTCWNVAINRPLMAFAEFVPGRNDSDARMRLSEEFCLHMAAAMLAEALPDARDGNSDKCSAESLH